MLDNKDVIRHMEFRDSLNIVLPDGIRAISGTDASLLFFHEIPAGVHSVEWRKNHSYEGYSNTYRLAFPGMLFGVQIIRNMLGDGRKFYTLIGACPFYLDRPFESLDQPLFFPVLPNHYVIARSRGMMINGRVVTNALNTCGANHIIADLNLFTAMRHVHQTFFGQSFTDAGADHYFGFVNEPGLRTFGRPADWETKTKLEPDFIKRIQWPHTGLTVRKLLDMHRIDVNKQPTEADAEAIIFKG